MYQPVYANAHQANPFLSQRQEAASTLQKQVPLQTDPSLEQAKRSNPFAGPSGLQTSSNGQTITSYDA